MYVLIACEESQRGHNAFSCDIQEPSGGHPEWHILGDALKAINGGQIVTMDGTTHNIPKWDLLIAHPPCTYLTNTGNRWFNIERYGDKARQRYKDREDAVKFFMAFVNADCDRPAKTGRKEATWEAIRENAFRAFLFSLSANLILEGAY